jgi:arylsulfatase A-like enzyme
MKVHIAACILALSSTCVAASKNRPNIIVIYTDDQGYADLAIQDQEKDLHTPNLDRLAREGARCTAGYSTAPQCSPARVGLLSGRYQQQLGIDTIPDLPLDPSVPLIPSMLKPAGYTSCMVGKWHLEPNPLCKAWIAEHLPHLADRPGRVPIPFPKQIPYLPGARGFDLFFCGEMSRSYANFTRSGDPIEAAHLNEKGFRVDIQTDAAVSFIRKHEGGPFFLYLSYYAPHTPLALPEPYVSRFTNDMPLRRRAALAMIHAIDHGVGRIIAELESRSIRKDTLIFFSSDNGAPIHQRRDSPLDKDMGGWTGSLNTPWIGEKGMLSEGGIRVPFLVNWPGVIPPGTIYRHPVSQLDIATTAVIAAGLEPAPNLEGIDLTPHLSKQSAPPPDRTLHWRFWDQIAIRDHRWKYLCVNANTEFLFDLASDAHESRNLIAEFPEIAARLRAKSGQWAATLSPPGPPKGRPAPRERNWYRNHFETEIDHQ